MSLKWLLRIFNFRMRYSKVEGGTRSLAAAPFGPDTRPRLPASASSMICRSRLASLSATAGSACCGKLTRRESLDNQAASTENTPSELTMTDLCSEYLIAEVYAFRNQSDEAFQWLDRASATHSDDLIETKVAPLLKSLHQDPRYAALLKKLNQPN